MVPCLLTSTDR